MGLDMYLYGRKYIPSDWKNPESNEMEDGFRVVEKKLDIGYWRKHPNLHGYIVNTFAGGKDDCQEIELSVEDVHRIIEAITKRKLPDTEGFFFGTSSADEDTIEGDIIIFKRALEWLVSDGFNSLVYQASW